ncbi:MAG TPA: hypothetical protein VH392_08885 [Sphingomicrobium sp.]
MRKLPAIAVGVAAAALAGAAVAAAPKTHKMDVPLPDGSVAHIEYVGDVAPKVTVAPRPMADAAGAWAMPFPSFAGFDKMFEQMQRQSQEMIRRAQEMQRQHPGTAPYVASYGSAPAAGTSTTIVSVSNNGQTCTRTTEVVSQGAGKPPKVTTNVSGQCGAEAPPPPSGPTHPA